MLLRLQRIKIIFANINLINKIITMIRSVEILLQNPVGSTYIGLLVWHINTELRVVHYYRTTCPTLEIQMKYPYRNITLSYIPNNPDELSGVYGRLVRCTVGHTVRLSWTTSSAAGHVVRPWSNTSTFGTEEVTLTVKGAPQGRQYHWVPKLS